MGPAKEGSGRRSGTGCGSATEGVDSWAAPAAGRAYKQGIWTLQELLILQAVRREDIVRRKEGFERQLKEGLAQKELKSRVERWQEIEEACWARGVHRSAEQCQSRWEYMSREWRRINRHESSCTRFGEPSYWAMSAGERTHRGLVSNFPFELYQALLDWVGKLTRNVHFHQCPGTADAAHSAGCTESSTSDVHGGYGECQVMDGNVESGATSSARQASSGEHQGHPSPGLPGPGAYHYPHLGAFPPPCAPGGMFPPFPYPPMPWPHPSYPMHPGYFQQPVMAPCAPMAGQVPGAWSPSCAAGFVPGEISSPCGHAGMGGCRGGTACSNSSFRPCICASCGTGQSNVGSGHAAAWGGRCQHPVKGSSAAAACPSVLSPDKPGQPAPQTQQKSPPDAGESVTATQFPQGPGDVMQSCHPGCKVGPGGAGFGGQQCSACSSGGFFPTNFVRPPSPFFYGSPVYLPYPCPRCNMNPWAFSHQPSPHSGHSGCHAQAPGPASWHKPEERLPEKPRQVLDPGGVPTSADAADITESVLTDGGITPFQEPQLLDTDRDTNEVEEAQYEDEPRFVMSEEWAEFFARSEARRREKKRQQKMEAKAARKAARGGLPSQEVDRPHLPDSEVNVDNIASGDVSQAFGNTSHPDPQLYIDL